MGERNNTVLKRLDRYIGSPLLYALGAFRTSRPYKALPENPRIMVLKTAAIGDTILMEAVLHEIKHAYPKSQITFVCSKCNMAMVKTLPQVDQVVCFEMKEPFASLQAIRGLGHFDLLLDFAPWARINGVISWVADAAFKVGFKRRHMYRHYVYDVAVEHSDHVHEMDNYRAILKAAHIPVQGFNPQLATDQAVHLPFEKFVVFHLFPGGSSVDLRIWAFDNWIALGARLYETYGLPILVTGGPEDAGAAMTLVDALHGVGVQAQSIAGAYPLRDMPSVLHKAQLVVSVNTGILHMSAAADVPLIALHGATSVTRWGPLSEKAQVIWSGEDCQPCISLGFESDCQDVKCMRNITVDRVMQAVDTVLGH